MAPTNNPYASLSNPFDYRFDNVAVSIGYEFTNLQRIVVAHGVQFDEFLDDLTTALRNRATSSEELLLLKMDMAYGNYFPTAMSEQVRMIFDGLFDLVASKIKSTIDGTNLYIGDRFDYGVAKFSNHGLLFTKNW